MATNADTYTSPRFRKLFLAEAADIIASMERDLLRLAEGVAPQDILNSVNRAAHTLKGNSAMTGYDTAAAFIHALETTYQQLNSGSKTLTPDLIQDLLTATDCIREILDAAPDDQLPPAALQIRDRLQETGQSNPKKSNSHNGSKGVETYRIIWSPAADSIPRGADPIRSLSALRTRTTILQTRTDWKHVPSLQDLDPERCYLTWQTTLSSREQPSEIRNWFNLTGPHLRLTIERNHDQAPTNRTPSDHHASQPTTTYLRVPKTKLENLFQLVTKLSLESTKAKSMASAREFTDDMLRILDKLERDSSILHREMLQLRQIELSDIFHRMPRMVHDLAIQLGKQIRVRIEGGENLLDRSHTEAITNALGHLIRNCADHGIEAPTDRIRAGKPIHGVIGLKAYPSSRHTIIEISDDGRGIQQALLHKRAIALGLLKPNETIENAEVNQLIFHPGLTTANEVTHHSGRGIGMDAVRAQLQSIHASIQVFTNPGEGTTFRLTIPNSANSHLPVVTPPPKKPAMVKMPTAARPRESGHPSEEEFRSPGSGDMPPRYP